MHTQKREALQQILFTSIITISLLVIIFSKTDIIKTQEALKNADLILISLTLILSVCTNIIFSSYIYKSSALMCQPVGLSIL